MRHAYWYTDRQTQTVQKQTAALGAGYGQGWRWRWWGWVWEGVVGALLKCTDPVAGPRRSGRRLTVAVVVWGHGGAFLSRLGEIGLMKTERCPWTLSAVSILRSVSNQRLVTHHPGQGRTQESSRRQRETYADICMHTHTWTVFTQTVTYCICILTYCKFHRHKNTQI